MTIVTCQWQAEQRAAQEGRRAHIAKAAIIAICAGLIVWLTAPAEPEELPQAASDVSHHECQVGWRCA
ncbi:hypothetical protein [Actibacterium sp. MT2.3-13A]|uniref:hypothetical protein n=1 Tax=Actibacterium sp. MT2.3-13A TaxID=2828332 RepID=UPI001BA6C142|nr:hypothetical protein [Actibacterium sp. MT2.3-13A]